MKPRRQPAAAAGGAPDFFSPDVAIARRFYLDLRTSNRRPLAVVCGGLEHCTPGYAIHRQTFPFYSLEYVVRGSGQIKLKARTFPLRPGRLFAYGPGIPHHIAGDAGSPLVKYFVDFSGTQALSLLRSCGLAPGSVSEVFPANSLQPLLDELIQAGLSAHPENARLCAKLLECLSLRINAARAPLEGAETLAFSTYQQCRRHLEQHYLQLRSLEQIACDCHINNAYLCRLFRRYDQQTPYQYLLRLKMNHAAERLQHSSLLVKQVAQEIGFPDPFHFSRAFKNLLGISPASFRRLSSQTR
jgi:AraC-like DNA-binding protein